MIARQELVRIATVVMNGLEKEIRQTLGFGLLHRSAEGPRVEVAAEVEGTSGFCFHMNPGFLIPLHTSAPGKAILAYLPEEEREGLIGQMTFEVFTEHTLRGPGALRKALAGVRHQGYATDRNEQVLNCHCVGVPVLLEGGSGVGALWTTGPADAIPEERFAGIASCLAGGARHIEASLSGIGRAMNAEYINLMVDRAIQRMRATLNGRLDMKRLAAELFVSYSWFRQSFKERTGRSPGQYHMQLRLEKAKDLLADPQFLIREVAAEVGFTDESYFSAHFKRKTGVSPKRYRERVTS